MSDLWFPRLIVPLTNKTYAMSRGGNVLATRVQGGLPRQRKRYSYDNVPFTLNFSMTDYLYTVFLQFYDHAIDGGGNSFKMNLDSGTGIVEHQVIISGGFKANRPHYNRWYVSFTATATVTPSQLDVCTNSYDLAQCHTEKELIAIICGLESFVTGIPENV